MENINDLATVLRIVGYSLMALGLTLIIISRICSKKEQWKPADPVTNNKTETTSSSSKDDNL